MRRNAAGQNINALMRTSSGTITAITTGVTMTVVKDGTMAAGAGTLTYIGTGTAIGSTAGAVTGVWKYAPTAGETNAASVSFIFGSATANTVVVEKFFEPTSGPILYQALLSATGGAVTNQTTIVLPSATPIPAADDDAYNGCEIVIYDGTTSGQVSVGVVADYVGSTRVITLREAPTFTVTTSDYITIIANQSLQSATKDRRLVVDAAGLGDANTVKIGPTGSGTAQTAGDLAGTRAEPAQGAPSATISFLAKIDWLYKAWRNKSTQTATDYKLYNDDAATVDHKATCSDDATTFTRGEIATGP